MIRPTEAQRSLLHNFEPYAFAVCDAFNRNPFLKRISHTFLSNIGVGWVYPSTRHLLHLHGIEHFSALAPDRGVLLVSNHRSFFDMYVSSCLMMRNSTWIKRMYFPVRSSFFYEQPAGVAVNAVMAAFAMYPPVLRESERKGFNRYVVDFLVDALAQPGTLVGYHPEGTRNKSDDPYSFLPVSAGVGELALRARPIVIPAFVNGLGNNLPKQVWSNYARNGVPITVRFGAPIELPTYPNNTDPRAQHIALSQHILMHIASLAEEDRLFRAENNMPLPPERKHNSVPPPSTAVAPSIPPPSPLHTSL